MRGLRRTIATAAVTLILAGFVAALGQMGLKIASHKKADKLRYQSGAVRLEHGKKCSVKNIKGPEPEPADPEQPSSPG